MMIKQWILGGPISGKAILEIQITQLSLTFIQYTQELGLKSFAHLSLTDLCPGRFLLRAPFVGHQVSTGERSKCPEDGSRLAWALVVSRVG